MRKSLVILFAIFVCALGSIQTAAQTELSVPPQATEPASSSVSAPNAGTSADIFGQIRDARRLLSSRPSSLISGDVVTLAALNPETSEISLFSVPKADFLSKDSELSAALSEGGSVRMRVLRANGVNTAVNVTDVATGRTLFPLMVQFPIVKGGVVAEIAYYTSAHPALLSPVVTSAGQTYVRTMLDEAAQRLAHDGVKIPADIVDIAEHLCIVEHTDHKRFMNEDRTLLFPEILSLYALNEGNTFRYSVSSAGAGGMIQMIPRTYAAIREQHPNVTLQADFVSGMRDHANALKAMLLYMNDTWTNLNQSLEVQEALRSGIATKPQLLAAGYNSNPMRLPLYLKNGGAEWRTLIPSETQMYLAIYSSVDSTLQLGSNSSGAAEDSDGAEVTPAVAAPSRSGGVLFWLARTLPLSGSFFARLLR
ncbi:MAG: hypothetical protein AABM67_22265 [Acidobacteriota bacterium]